MTLPKRASTFAEIPVHGSSRARIIWHACHDPAVLAVHADRRLRAGDSSFDLRALAVTAVVAVAPDGREHVVLTDGYRRLRMDIISGSVLDGPVCLQYQLQGLRLLDAQLLTLRRLIALVRTGRFAKTLFPPDLYAGRIADALRTHDALAVGASQREIATQLFGADMVDRGWSGSSDFLKSRIRRLVRLARQMAAGDYCHLMR